MLKVLYMKYSIEIPEKQTISFYGIKDGIPTNKPNKSNNKSSSTLIL